MRGLIDDLGINLAGVEVVMKLLDRIDDMQADVASLEAENRRLKRILEVRRGPALGFPPLPGALHGRRSSARRSRRKGLYATVVL